MIIIVEGLDNVGKTSVIERLNKDIYLINNKPTLMLHYGKTYNLKHGKIQYKNAFKLIKKLHKKYNLIFDRLHGGEVVYSPIYRNYFGDYVYEYEKTIANIDDVHLLYLYTSPEILFEREDGKSQSNKDIDLIREELRSFDNFVDQSNIKNKHIIETNNHIDITMEKIYKKIF